MRVMGCKNKHLGTEKENFSSNQSGATREEKGRGISQHMYGWHCAAAREEEMGSESRIITAGLEVGVALMGSLTVSVGQEEPGQETCATTGG